MRLQLKIIRKKFFKILLSMTIIISLGVALLFGLMNGVLSLRKSVDKFIEENNYPDIKIITKVEDIEKIKSLNKKEYKNIEYRLSMNTIINKNNNILSVKVNTYEDKNINNFYIYEEKENNSKYYDIFVEKRFANNNKIKLGDIVKLKIGKKNYNFYVSKIISIPEAIVSIPINGMWGEINDYGNVYINRKVLKEETNKTKRKLLSEVEKKEEEILKEEKNRLEEYNNAKNKINQSLNEYYNQKKRYEVIKNNAFVKKNELNHNKEKLIELKKEYINVTDNINQFEDIIYSYIYYYDISSNKTKEYIDKIIEDKYPNIKTEDLEFITDIAYFILEGKINELFGFENDIGQKIITWADKVKSNNLKPYYEKIVKKNNLIKERIKTEVDTIYNSNKSIIEKAKIITNKVFDYTQNIVDESVLSMLSEYTNNTNDKPLPTINRLLNEIDTGFNEINNNINNLENKLNKAYQSINNNQTTLEETYNTFNEKISKVKQELNNKKIEIKKIEGYESKFNEILISLYQTNNKEEILKNILDKDLKKINVLDSYTYERSPIYNYIDINIGVMKKLSTIVPIAFYIIILVVLFLFISLMIKQGKKEIAILKLLGKTNSSIRLGFCINNLIVAMFGIILGIIIGFFPMIYMVQYFKNFFLFTSVVYTIDISSIILCIVITIIVTQLATIIATAELNKISPIEILKKEEYQDKEISKITRLITNQLKPFTKFNFLVYIRNKSKLILGIICTSATVVLIFSSLAYVASKDKIFNHYFDDRIHYDAQIFKTGTITDKNIDELRKLSYIKNADLLRYFNVKVRNNNKELDIVINALDNKNKYISIFDKDNREIEYPKNGIVLEEHIAKDLGLELNDEIMIEGIPFKIVDISFQSLGRVNYISLTDSNKLKSSFDTIILNMDKDKQNELINKVSNSDNYIYTVFNDELKEYNKKTFDSYTLPSIIIIIFTIIIGYIIIINLNLYNLLSQKKNLSIFRSLGFQYNEISKNWFIQSLIQWIISIIIGIPCGILLSKFFLKFVSSSKREFIYASGIKECIITIILLLIYLYMGHKKCMRKFKKMDIVEEVKDRD